MNYVLVDIKKFLKKLETGQMEIEAGQWELHKDITNLKNSMLELMLLKKDLQQMNDHSLKQTDLIKELQLKLSNLEKMNGDNICFTSCSHKELHKLGSDHGVEQHHKTENHDKVHQSHKNLSKVIHRHSTKFSKFKPSNLIHKRFSKKGFRGTKEKEEKTSKGTKHKNEDDLTQPCKKMKTYSSIQTHTLSEDDILKRYLKDSERYRKLSKMSVKSSEKSIINEKVKIIEENLQNNSNSRKSYVVAKPSKLHKPNITPKASKSHKSNTTSRCEASHVFTFPDRYGTIDLPEKSSFRDICLRRDKRHIKKNKNFIKYNMCKKCLYCNNDWKNHKKILKNMSKILRGFKCSYCDKICNAPEKLTAHLKTCRIITKCNSNTNK